MRKALTVSAIAVAASMALAVPATAFAADGTPSDSPSQSAPADQGQDQAQDQAQNQGQDQAQNPSKDGSDQQVSASLSVSPGSAKAGDKVQLHVTAPAGSTNIAISSKALSGVEQTDEGATWTATVADVDAGNYGVAMTGVGPSGQKLQATANLKVEAPKPTPDPAKPALSLSTDGGKVGDKVSVTVENAGSDSVATVKSEAFGGTVKMERDPQHEGTWHGTATVADSAKSGYYRVDALLDGKVVDSAKFGVQGSDKPTPPPAPGKSYLAVNPGSGKKGDKVAVTVDAPSINPTSKVSADSQAFGGKVSLSLGKDGKWHGTATVADVKNGSYKVTTGTGAHPVTFTVTSKSPVKPLNPSDHKTPKGSVNTGMAPVSHGQEGLNSAAVVGFAALGAGSLTGAGLLRRRRNHG